MRIIEIISGLGLGGAERALARRLVYAPEGTETYVIVTGGQDSHLSAEIQRNATILRRPSSISRIVDSLRPDLILTHNPREALRVLAHRSLPKRYEVVAVAHNEITSESPAKAMLLDKALAKVNSRARMHIAVSSRAARGPQCANGDNVQVCLLGGSFDTSSAPQSSYWPSETNHRVLVLSRLSPQKNLVALVDAVNLTKDQLRRAGTHIVVAGDGKLKLKLINEVSRLRLSDLVSFPGWIEDSDSLTAGSHTMLITSANEGGPLTLYEALLAGTRVVSTPVGAAPDLLPGHRNLHVLDGYRVSDLVEGLMTIASSTSVTEEERSERRRTFQDLAVSVMAPKFYSLCSSLTS